METREPPNVKQTLLDFRKEDGKVEDIGKRRMGYSEIGST